MLWDLPTAYAAMLSMIISVDEALARARQALAARGMGLILGFVPNHVAPDHPWTSRRARLPSSTPRQWCARLPAAVRRPRPTAQQLSAPVLQQLSGGLSDILPSRSPPPSGAGGQRRQGPAQRARTRLRQTRPLPRPLNRMNGRFVQSGHTDRRTPHVTDVGWPTRALNAAAIVSVVWACWPRSGSADPGRRPRPTRIDWGCADHPAGGVAGGTFR
jgi:hypothetical protein